LPPSSLEYEKVRSFQALDQARDERELYNALGALLAAPYLILEIGDGDLTAGPASLEGPFLGQPVHRWEERALNVTADEGRFLGSWEPHPVHEPFSDLIQEGDFVVAERVGSLDRGFVVVQKVRFDGYDDGETLDRARAAWESIQASIRA